MLNLGYIDHMSDMVLEERALEDLMNSIGVESFVEFCERFMVDCSARTDRINEAFGKSHFTDLELEAHTLASSAATYGAKSLEELCREIEFARPIKDAAFQDRIDRLNYMSEECIRALSDYVDGVKSSV